MDLFITNSELSDGVDFFFPDKTFLVPLRSCFLCHLNVCSVEDGYIHRVVSLQFQKYSSIIQLQMNSSNSVLKSVFIFNKLINQSCMWEMKLLQEPFMSDGLLIIILFSGNILALAVSAWTIAKLQGEREGHAIFPRNVMKSLLLKVHHYPHPVHYCSFAPIGDAAC